MTAHDDMIAQEGRLLEFKGSQNILIAGAAFGEPDDPPVLLLPASGLTREIWYGAAHALAKAGRYAICVDLRGHGASAHSPEGDYRLGAYAADLTAILCRLPARAVVVAQGASALAAMLALTGTGTQLASALVLVGATLWVEEKAVQRMQAAMSLRATEFCDQDDIMSAICALHPTEPQPVARSALLAAFSLNENGRYRWRGDPRTFEAIDLSAEMTRLREAVAGLNLPVALMRGLDNESVTAAAIRDLQALVAQSEIVEIEGSGHYVAVDRLDLFNAALLDFLERKAPRVPIAYRSGSDPRLLRDALGCFGTGVTIVTTLSPEGEPIGLTVNSFTSVSLDPPLILFGLANKSGSLDTFRAAGRFAINVLHIGQQPASNRFARRDASRFEGVEWEIRREGGSPILSGSLASFDCRTYAMHEAGDHLILIGEVVHAYFEPHRDPLLYFRGRYRRLHFI